VAWNTLKNILTGSSGLTTNAGTASSALGTINAGTDVLTTNFSGVKATVDSVSGMASELSSGPYTLWKDSGAPSGVTSGAVAGQLYFDSSSNKLWQYSGSVWVEISDLDNVGGVSDAAKTYLGGKVVATGNLVSGCNQAQNVETAISLSGTTTFSVPVTGMKVLMSCSAPIYYSNGSGSSTSVAAQFRFRKLSSDGFSAPDDGYLNYGIGGAWNGNWFLSNSWLSPALTAGTTYTVGIALGTGNVPVVVQTFGGSFRVELAG